MIRAVDGSLVQAGKEEGEGAAITAWALQHRQDMGTTPADGGRM